MAVQLIRLSSNNSQLITPSLCRQRVRVRSVAVSWRAGRAARVAVRVDLGRDDEGQVAHEEGLEGGYGRADEPRVDLDVAPDHLRGHVVCVVGGVEQAGEDDGSLDGGGADTDVSQSVS